MNRTASARRGPTRNPRVPFWASSTSVEPIQKGSFVAENPTSVGLTASRKHQTQGFGLGSGEAHRELFVCAPSPVTTRQPGRRLRPTTGPAKGHTGVNVPSRTEASATVRISANRIRRAPGFAAHWGLSPRRQRRLGLTPSGVGPNTRERSPAVLTQSVTLPRIVTDRSTAKGRGD